MNRGIGVQPGESLPAIQAAQAAVAAEIAQFPAAGFLLARYAGSFGMTATSPTGRLHLLTSDPQ